MDKLKQIDKLLSIKELRRRLAELEVAKARRSKHNAERAVDHARENEQHVINTSDERRMKRLNELLAPGKHAAVQNARVVNVYAMTDQEIAFSQQATRERIGDLDAAKERAKMEQAKLARFLQLEERTKKLCERLVKMKQTEAARLG